MIKTKILHEHKNDTDYLINCPQCDHWEAMNIDEQRHHIQTFEILEWLPSYSNGTEVSYMECSQCKARFLLEWKYKQ